MVNVSPFEVNYTWIFLRAPNQQTNINQQQRTPTLLPYPAANNTNKDSGLFAHPCA